MEQTNGTQRTRLPLYGDAANGNTKRQLDDVDIEAELRAFEEAERERLGIKAARRQWADTMLTPEKPREPYSWEVPPPIAPQQVVAHQRAADEWAASVDYRLGDQVSWHGVRYTCRQAHTSLPTWEPSINTLALWLPLTDG